MGRFSSTLTAFGLEEGDDPPRRAARSVLLHLPMDAKRADRRLTFRFMVDESVIIPHMINRDAINAELLEIEGMLQDDRLSDYDRIALHGAQQALRNILEPDTWHPASQTFYRIDNRPSEAGSLLVH